MPVADSFPELVRRTEHGNRGGGALFHRRGALVQSSRSRPAARRGRALGLAAGWAHGGERKVPYHRYPLGEGTEASSGMLYGMEQLLAYRCFARGCDVGIGG